MEENEKMGNYGWNWLDEQKIPKSKINYSEETLEDLNDYLISSMSGNESVDETYPVLKSDYAEFSVITSIATIIMCFCFGGPIGREIICSLNAVSGKALMAELPWLLFFFGIPCFWSYICISGLYKNYNVNKHGQVIEGKVCGIYKMGGKNSRREYIVLINTRRGYRWLKTYLPSRFFDKGEIVRMKIYKNWVIAERKLFRFRDLQ